MTTRRSHNPYIIALWLVGVGSTVLGAAGFGWAVWLSFGGSLNYSSDGIVVPVTEFAQRIGPQVTLVGLGTLVALQFLRVRLRIQERAAVITPAP